MTRAGRLASLARDAVGSVREHPTRSLLCISGVAAGIAAVVASFAMSGGARRRALEEFGPLGPDNVFVRGALSEYDVRAIAANQGSGAVTAVKTARVEVAVATARTMASCSGVDAGWRPL